ncbi:Vta1 like-domain-containing protein [Paraphysoderma sedebokerense]|nr:Vta1 like-domain-containing protein [Paraphysoderma sedebokerense]
MASVLPPVPQELSFISPFLQRAAELQNREPILSYYCKFYAVRCAITDGPKNKSNEVKAFLGSLMDNLEQEKTALAGNEAITNETVGMSHVENFALKIFLNADNEDRAGKASRKTAKTFLAASIFLELLKNFGDLEPETKEKIKYSKWKAADIMKALKEGRQPTPGPPGEQQVDEVNLNPQSGAPSSMDQPPSSSIPQYGQPPPQSDFEQQPSAPADFTPNFSADIPHIQTQPVQPIQPTMASTQFQSGPSSAVSNYSLNYDPAVMSQAQKHARYVISALEYDDVKTAVDNLKKALNLLEPYLKK